MDVRFSGIITPLATPLDKQGNVDGESLAGLIDWQIGKGVHGIFVLGTNGEGNLLKDDQKREVVMIASESVRGRVPLMCGVSDVSFPRVIDNMCRIKKLDFDAYVTTLPYYCITKAEEQQRFYKEVCDAADRAVMAYNIPSFVRTDIALDVIEKMASHERFAGVKESGGDLVRYRKLMSIKAGKPELSFFTGCSHLLDAAYSLGFDGGVVGLANVAPGLCGLWHTLYMRGDDESAKAVQAGLMRILDKMLALCGAHGQVTTISCNKAVLKGMGIIKESTMVAPYSSAFSDDEKGIAELCRLIASEESTLERLSARSCENSINCSNEVRNR